MDSRASLDAAVHGEARQPDHATVITDKWWFNGKVDGPGALPYDLKAAEPFERSVAEENCDIASDLFARAVQDAGGRLPDWLIEHARTQAEAPGCSPLVAQV